MLSIVVAMAIVLVVALVVVVYAAFPHRGADIPAAPWLGDAMAKAVGALPTLEHDESREGSDVPAGAAVGSAGADGADGVEVQRGGDATEDHTGEHDGEPDEEHAGRHRVGFTR